MIIYRALFPNGKCYIGKTIFTLEKRRIGHLCAARTSSEFAFHRAIRKYGENNILWETLFKASNEKELDLKEIEFIEKFKSFGKCGYNMTTGGDRGTPSLYVVEKSKRTKLKNGYKISEETKHRISETLLNKKIKHTKEHKIKLSKLQPFYIFKDGINLGKFELISDVVTRFTLCMQNVRSCLYRKYKYYSHNGYKFMFVHEYEQGMSFSEPKELKVIYSYNLKTKERFEGTRQQLIEKFGSNGAYCKIFSISSTEKRTYKSWIAAFSKQELEIKIVNFEDPNKKAEMFERSWKKANDAISVAAYKNNNLVQIFISVKQACRILELKDPATVYQVLDKENRSYRGYKFKTYGSR